MDQWTDGPIDQWTNGPMDHRTNGPIDQWTKGIMDQWSRCNFYCKFLHFSGIKFTGQKMHWRTKNYKYEVWVRGHSVQPVTHGVGDLAFVGIFVVENWAFC